MTGRLFGSVCPTVCTFHKHSFSPYNDLRGRFCFDPHLQTETLRLRDVKQLAPQDRDRMRHVLGTRTDPTPLSSLSHRGNVECGWSDEQCPGLKGLCETGLSVLQPGMSQKNWDNLANLGGLTLSNLLRYLCEELFFRKPGTVSIRWTGKLV